MNPSTFHSLPSQYAGHLCRAAHADALFLIPQRTALPTGPCVLP